MNNYKLTLAYDGARYSGWQVQGNTDKTIQGRLTAVLERLLGEEIEVHGSGRTDAGVHAIGQVANFKTKQELLPRKLREQLNQYLPEDIVVEAVEPVAPRFHSRLSAVAKTYRYRLWTADVPPVFERKYVTVWEQPINKKDMELAAGYLLGTHDFTSFCGNRHYKKSAVRTIYDIRFIQKERELWIEVTGNGFLQNMMRILVGTLLEVGEESRKPEDMKRLLEGRDRSLAGKTMPPQGLCLLEVNYEE